MKKIFFAATLLSFVACNTKTKPSENTDPNAPKVLSYSIVGTYPHDTSHYTQGLIIYKGDMYEGTGLESRSKLMKVDLKTGKALNSIDLDPKYFGEGVTILNDTVYQLTWKNKVVLVYTLKDFKKIKEIPLDIVGWGLTNDGKNLIVSTGSSELDYYEPFTFKLIKTITVTDSGMPAGSINELEYINGFVYANQYLTSYIFKIDAATGKIVAKTDFTEMTNHITAIAPGADVLNGIAYDAATKKIYITGKLWPELYEVQFSQ
jgi:glutaminyl-peptide cyclotransferase